MPTTPATSTSTPSTSSPARPDSTWPGKPPRCQTYAPTPTPSPKAPRSSTPATSTCMAPSSLRGTLSYDSVVADYRVVPESTVGVLLLISSLELLRRRLLGLARYEVLNQPLPCSIPALTGLGSGVILSAIGSGPVSGPLGFNGPAKRADRIFQLVNTTDTAGQTTVGRSPSPHATTHGHAKSFSLSVISIIAMCISDTISLPNTRAI